MSLIEMISRKSPPIPYVSSHKEYIDQAKGL
jgi:hypothetical protein